MEPPYVIVVSDPDPVAVRVAERWGTPPATGDRVDGVPLRRLDESRLVLRRPGLHVRDERLDLKLPASLRETGPVLVFPSIHRSRENVVCLTVHPLGNFGPTAEVGGRPRTVDPSDPRAMAAVLRLLSERGARDGWKATYESTHHGPELAVRAFFAEVGYGTAPEPPGTAVAVLAQALREFVPDPQDRVALAVGGGHYAPHFTELALRRSWSFGHIVSRHALEGLDRATAHDAYERTPGAEGILFARAQDASHPALSGLGPRLKESAAPARPGRSGEAEPTRASRPAGT